MSKTYRQHGYVKKGAKGRCLKKKEHDFYRNRKFDAQNFGVGSFVEGVNAGNVKRHSESGCKNKVTHKTLSAAYSAKLSDDEKYGTEHYIYHCNFCGKYHLTTHSSNGCIDINAMADFHKKLNADKAEKKEEFHERLARMMAERGIDDGSMAKKVGVRKKDVLSWKSGSKYPFKQMLRISEILGTSIEELMK